MGKALELDMESLEKISKEIANLESRLANCKAIKKSIRKAAMDAAGWVKCCHCYPSVVYDDGLCGCCMFNHITGEWSPENG